MYELFANFTVIIHLIFILFVVFGGLLFFIFSKIIFIHIPALLWGIYIELTNYICPLTYLENWLLYKGGLTTYSNNFINNYILPIIYPEGLKTEIQIYFGITLVIINILIYGFIFKNLKKNKGRSVLPFKPANNRK
tara:strand:- start:11 stop:418 length:408 start_codon:yes stop_codon:yes gene_type:complete